MVSLEDDERVIGFGLAEPAIIHSSGLSQRALAEFYALGVEKHLLGGGQTAGGAVGRPESGRAASTASNQLLLDLDCPKLAPTLEELCDV